MSKSIKIKLNRKGEFVKVKVLIRHPMETGLRKIKSSGKTIPAHFIKEVTCYHNENVVLEAMWGVAISKNPYLSFYVEHAKPGDTIKINWKDNLGKSDSLSQKIA